MHQRGTKQFLRFIAMTLAMSMASSSLTVMAQASAVKNYTVQTAPATQIAPATQTAVPEARALPARAQSPLSAGKSTPGSIRNRLASGLGSMRNNMPASSELVFDFNDALKDIQPGDRLLVNPDGTLTIDEKHREEARIKRTLDSGKADEKNDKDKPAKPAYLDSDAERTSSQENPEWQGILSDAEINNYRTYLESEPLQGDELDRTMAASDVWSAEVTKRILDSNYGDAYMAKLDQDKPSDKFVYTPMPAQTSGFNLFTPTEDTRVLSAVVDNMRRGVRDSSGGGGGGGADKNEKEEQEKEEREKEEQEKKDAEEKALAELEQREAAESGRAFDPGADIFIVDEDTVIMQVKDHNGDPINGVAVSIKVGDRSMVNKVTETLNGAKGCVVFTGMTGLNTGYLNIAMDGYRIITRLDTDLHGGVKHTYKLIPVGKKEIYPRVMDLGGADMLNSTPELFLIDKAQSKYALVLVLSGGSSETDFNWQKIGIYAKNGNDPERLIMRDTDAEKYSDGPHWKYTFNDLWAKRWTEDRGLRAGDKVYFKCSTDSSIPQFNANVTVKDAPFEKPWYLPDLELGFSGGYAKIKLPDWVPLVGGTPYDLEIMECPVLAIVNISGAGMIGINTGAQKAIEKTSFDKHFDAPRYNEKVSGIINKIKQYVKGKIEHIAAAGKFVGSFDEPKAKYFTKLLAVRLRTMLFAQCKYNWDTGYVHSGISALLSVSGEATATTYLVVPPPIYLGLTFFAGAILDGGLGVRFKPGDQFSETFELDKTSGMTGFAIAASVGATLFAGVGLRGVMSLEAGGGLVLSPLANFKLQEDIRPKHKSYPRFTLDLSFTYYVKVFLAFFSIGKSDEKKLPTFIDTWDLNTGAADEEDPSETEVYKVVFDGMAEGEGSSYDPKTGIITPGTLYEQPPSDYGPMNGTQGGLDGYGFTAMSGVGTGANSPIRYVRAGDDMYVFRLAVVKDTYMGIPYEHPVLVYQKQMTDGTFENKYYQIPIPEETKYKNYNYDYEFDVKQNPGFENYVTIALVSGYRGVLYDMEDCMLNTVPRFIRINLKESIVQTNIVCPVVGPPAGKGYIHSPVISKNGASHVASWVNTENPLSQKPNTRKNFLVTIQSEFLIPPKIGGVELGYEKELPLRTISGPILPLISGTGKPSPEDGDVYIANSWYEDQEYKLSTYNASKPGSPLRETSLKIKNPATVRMYEIDPLAGGQNFMMYVDNGALKLFAGDKSKLSADQIVTRDGNPFMLPKNCDTYAYASGMWYDKAVMKLVTIHKDFPDMDTSKKADSVIRVYDIQRVSAAKIVARGPREYRLKGVDVVHSEIVFNEWGFQKGLNMIYTANNKTNMVKEFNADGQGATGEITTVCDIYHWVEPSVSSAKVTAFTLEQPVISKKDKTIKVYAEVENNGSLPLTSFNIEVKDNDGRIVSTNTETFDLYPGEKQMFTWTFDQPAAWKVGPQRLTARVTQANSLGWDGVAQTVQIEDIGTDSITQAYERCYLEVSGNDVVYDSGNHFAALTIRNRSMMPTGDNTELRIYRIDDKSDVDGIVYDKYDLGSLEEGDPRNSGIFEDHCYNMTIPLQKYWDDENCSGVLISVACNSIDGAEASLELSNPNAALRFPVHVDASDAAYGTVEGGGYLLPGSSRELKAEPRRGYRFTGWADETGRIVSTDPVYTMDVPSEIVNLTAQFEETGEVHKVALEVGKITETMANGTTQQIKGGIPIVTGGGLNGTYAESYAVDHGTTIELSANPVGDYAFIHWEDEDGNILSTREEFTIPVTQKMGIKAVYAKGVRRFNLALEAGVGGECETGSMWTNTKGEMDTPLPDAFKSGSQFLGWFTQESGGTRVTESHVFTDDTILYAHYSGSSGGGGGGSGGGGGGSGGNKLLPPKKDKDAAASSSAPSKPELPASSSVPAPAQSQPQNQQASGAASTDTAASSDTPQDTSSDADSLLSSSDTSEAVESSSAVQQPDATTGAQEQDKPREGGVPIVPIAVGVVALLVLIGGGAAAMAASGGVAATSFGGKLLAFFRKLFKR